MNVSNYLTISYSLVLMRLLPSLPGGTRPLTWALSSSKVLISVTYLGTLAVTWIWAVSCKCKYQHTFHIWLNFSARSVEWYEEPGKLSKIPIDESKIDEDLRIPRLTSAIWKYENGAVGSFQHAVALQGTAYSCELEVWADGQCEPINMFYQTDSRRISHEACRPL